jgi:dihydrofolate reductase
MAQLVYVANTSLDGYVEDEDGKFDFTTPSDEVHLFLNDVVRQAGTHLYGRRMYETMMVWETDPSLATDAVGSDFAEVWQAADKVVYSTTLPDALPTRRTRLERVFDPAAVRAMKASAARDLIIGGAGLAAEAFRAGLVDECRLLLAPTALGGGKPALPRHARIELELLDERRFASGTVHLHYRVTT